MSLLGDNKLVHALESVNDLAPTLHELVDVLRAMSATLIETNTELRAVKDELDAVKASMAKSARQVKGAADQMGLMADRLVPE